LFAFSTVVSEMRGSELMQASVGNTQGTDINAVLRHAAAIPAKNRPKVMLIVTDGYVGPAGAELVAVLSGVRIVAALTEPGYDADLKPWISELNQLPKP
jgi:inactivated superfamily I helicase